MKLSFMKESLERDTVHAQRRSTSHGEFPPDGCHETEHSGDLFSFRSEQYPYGPVAQLGAHHIRIVGVVGSNPIRSTRKQETPRRKAAAFFFAEKSGESCTESA